MASEPTRRPGTFNQTSIAIMSVLVTLIITLTITLVGKSSPTSYDRDSAYLKATIAENTQNIHDLTIGLQQLTVQVAALQEALRSHIEADTKPGR